MDSLRSCVAPLQEYLLQGSILDSQRDLLLHRLSGLCDSVDTGPEKFHDQELVYTLRKFTGINAYFYLTLFVNRKSTYSAVVQHCAVSGDFLTVNFAPV